jgi:para-nitrobenzyl esterase
MQNPPGLGDPEALYNKEWHVDPELPMSEDCLYLNIWTPAKRTDEKLPVMIWFFGGGLQGGYTGEMEFDGERIARRGIVLVSVNYRVNAFGFLSHPEITAEDPDGVNGNWGFLDQKASIDWVRRNIINFGGAPDNITIFGQSGGGRSVLAHMTSPMSAGSFQKCIAESCGAMRVWAPKGLEREYPDLRQAEQTGKEFFDFMGVKSLAEARALSARIILEKNNEFAEAKGARMGCFGFTIDGKYVAEDPTNVFLSGRHHKIPFIMGLTKDEFHIAPGEGNREHLEAWAVEKFGDKSQEFISLCL